MASASSLPAAASSLPSSALQDLCTRAISSPSSITPSERALILARPDPATENDLYIVATSLPLPALIAKALTTPPTLSPQEAQVLVYGPIQRTHAERAASLQDYDALMPEQRRLLDRASEAVADKEESKATNVAWRVLQSAKAEEKKKASERTSPNPTAGTSSSVQRQGQADTAGSQPQQVTAHYRKPIVFPWERTDWISLVREKNYSSWGLVVLRTAYDDPAAWLTFKSRFDALAARELRRIAPPIADTFRVKYIDDEESLAGAEQAGLLAHYARLLRQGEVGEGYQWGIFVSVDERVLEEFISAEERQWIVPVWEAGWRAGEVGEHGWKGALAVLAGLVFAVVVPKVVRGDKRPLEMLDMMASDR